MIVVHGLAAPSGPLVWAEEPARLPPSDPVGDEHPFAAAPAALAGLTAAGNRIAASLTVGGSLEVATVALPTGPAGPVPSPGLMALGLAGVPPTVPAALSRWRVPAARLDLTASLDALHHGGPGWRPGASLRFLCLVAEFAADLVARGQVVPTVDAASGGPFARWVPVPRGGDAAQFDALAEAMPPAFRALAAGPGVGDAAGAVRGTAGGAALGWTLPAVVDAVARARLAGLAPAEPEPAAGAGRGRRRAKPAADAWIRALAADPRFTATPRAVRELTDAVGAWLARGRSAGPAVTCFRLWEPRGTGEPDDRWWVEILLRPAADPSLLVPAEAVWDGRAAVLPDWVDDSRDALLTGLGRAVTVWPALQRALAERRPGGLSLDTEEAHAFLRVADALRQAGFGVLLPTSWRRRGQLTLTLAVRTANPVTPTVRDTALTLGELVDFRWGVALGGARLSRAELDDLAAAKVPLVRVRGRWAQIDPELLARGLALTAAPAGARMTARDVLGHAGLLPAPSLLAQFRPVGEVEVSADGWLAGLLGGATGPAAREYLELVDPPAGLGVTLRNYQRRGLAWLAFLDRLGVGALLADDMGLGKTLQVLALELLTRQGGPRPPSLVVCPTSVVGHWLAETGRVAPGLRVYAHHGADRPAGERLAAMAAQHDLVVTTYAVLRRDVPALGGLAWDRLVLDEAQQIKNSGTQLARAARRLPARHRVALTGTPVENRLADLWSIMNVLNPGLLGGAGEFRARYAVPIERYGDEDAAARLRRRLRPVLLRRVKTSPDVAGDLPAKTELRDLCTLTPEQASLYRAVLDDMLERLADRSPVRRSGVVLAAMTKLKQVCNHPAHLLGDGSPLAGRSGKLARLEQVLDQVVAAGERALCFTQFARYGAMLAPYLSERFGVEVPFLHGGTPRAGRDALVERFQAGRGPGIFLLSLKAGGTGLNLTAANHVLHLDRWWNPAAEAQATDRAHRIGQRRAVFVRTFVCMGTLEERVDGMIADKVSLARSMIGNGEAWLATLSTSQLRDLCTLAPEALDAADA